MQAEFLALVQVRRAGQGQHQQDRGPGPPQAQAAIQSRGGTAVQQPGPGGLVPARSEWLDE
jgi:hypothetical protein